MKGNPSISGNFANDELIKPPGRCLSHLVNMFFLSKSRSNEGERVFERKTIWYVVNPLTDQKQDINLKKSPFKYPQTPHTTVKNLHLIAKNDLLVLKNDSNIGLTGVNWIYFFMDRFHLMKHLMGPNVFYGQFVLCINNHSNYNWFLYMQGFTSLQSSTMGMVMKSRNPLFCITPSTFGLARNCNVCYSGLDFPNFRCKDFSMEKGKSISSTCLNKKLAFNTKVREYFGCCLFMCTLSMNAKERGEMRETLVTAVILIGLQLGGGEVSDKPKYPDRSYTSPVRLTTLEADCRNPGTGCTPNMKNKLIQKSFINEKRGE